MVYCEGEHRKSSVWHYATHVDAFREYPYHMVGVILECVADQTAGSTVHKQWVQPPNKIAVVAAIFHVVHLYKFTEKPYLGWFRLGGRVFTQYGLCLESDSSNRWQASDLPGHLRCTQRTLCIGSRNSDLIAHCEDGEPKSLYCEECFVDMQKSINAHPLRAFDLECQPWSREETLPFSLRTENAEVEISTNSRAASSTD